MEFQFSNSETKPEEGREEYWAYLSDRVQKITKAVYRVTDILSDKEPLKWALREKSVFILNTLVFLEKDDYLGRIPQIKKIEQSVNQIILALSLLPDNFLLSGINFEILKNEYSAINKLVFQEVNKFNFNESFLNTLAAPEIPNGHNPVKQKHIGQNDIGQKDERNDISQINGHSGEISEETRKENSNITKKGKPSTGGRKQRLMSIIKDREKVTVGELSVLFSEYSEKTIQRDLLEMVERGILRKEGDKRWRTYLLNRE